MLFRSYAISTWHKADMTHDVMTDEDRAYLAHVMAEAAANPKPPAPPKPPAKPVAPPAIVAGAAEKPPEAATSAEPREATSHE